MRIFWSLRDLCTIFPTVYDDEEAQAICTQTGLVDFWNTLGSAQGRTGVKSRLQALLERWWDTTNTFHMIWGEITITPFEFAMITGLPFSEREVTFDPKLTWHPDGVSDLIGPVVDLTSEDTYAPLTVIMAGIRRTDISAEQRVKLFLLALVSRVMAPGRSSRVLVGFLGALSDLRVVSDLNWGGLAYNHLLYEMKNASRTAPESKASVAALWSVLEIWAYEHFLTLAPARPGVAAYPYAASWVGAVRSDVSLENFRRALRVWPVGQVVWCPFDGAPTPDSSMRAYFLSGWWVLLPGVYRHMWYLGERVSLQHSTRGRLVPKNPPETMLAKIEDVAQLYSDAMEAGDESICLPWRIL
ncbi:protein MAINTENANCE OF MERISTEMS [Spinacia oleracea]|uniref:Protein MAINTENANCE OF MERISTEMS n=1 Tax=Spinacia oleracea TaxID=3562 RepID=A0ABM3QH02_SPIOL|nr:protein MAINTENANCE OF MERISTEMS-like [Spinacia oleracea]